MFSCGTLCLKFSPPLIQLKFIVQRLPSVHINSTCNIASGNKFMNMWVRKRSQILFIVKLEWKQKLEIFLFIVSASRICTLAFDEILKQRNFTSQHQHNQWYILIWHPHVGTVEQQLHACMILWYDPDPDKWGSSVSHAPTNIKHIILNTIYVTTACASIQVGGFNFSTNIHFILEINYVYMLCDRSRLY